MNYNSCAIEVNNMCKLHCKHCCQNYDIGYDYIEIKDFQYIVDNISKSQKIEAICLTGGEVFSDLDILVRYFEILKKTNRYLTLVTSAIWANKLKETKEILYKLRNCGLKLITISFDEFHFEYVPHKNVINLINACNDLKIKSDIQIPILNNSDLSNVINPIKKYLYKTGIRVYPAYPIGRAAYFDSKEIIRSNINKNLSCGKGNSFEIEYDGRINPCCSPYAKYIDFNLGNIYNSHISEIFDKLEKHTILMYLRNKGFGPFLKMADNKNISLPDRVVSSCEICHYLFSDNMYLNYVIDIYKELDRI